MDFGAHNLMLAWLEARSPRCHRAFIFLNSSTRGPFYPMYMSQGWQWTDAFTSRLSNTVKVYRRAAAAAADVTAAGLATCALLTRLWATKLLHDQLSSLALNQTLRPCRRWDRRWLACQKEINLTRASGWSLGHGPSTNEGWTSSQRPTCFRFANADVPRVRAEFTSRFGLHNVARWSPTTCLLILNKHHIHRLLFSLCRGIIHRGEFGISDAIMRAGYNIATLMAKYPKVWHRPTND